MNDMDGLSTVKTLMGTVNNRGGEVLKPKKIADIKKLILMLLRIGSTKLSLFLADY